jgi:hypothetical protein
VVDNPSDQVVDIVAAGDTAVARTRVVVDIVVVVPVAHTQVVVDIAVVVPAGCMEPAHTGLDMVVVALDIVQMALHLPGTGALLPLLLLQAHCHTPHRNAHLERPVVRSWCRSYSVAERSDCLLRAYLLLAQAFRNFDKIFCQ